MSNQLQRKQRKITYLIILVAIAIIAVVTIKMVNAMSWNFQVAPSKTIAKPGDYIQLTMKISEIDMGNLGINAIESVLEYDDSVFETVAREDFKMSNNWTATYNQEAGAKNGNFLLSNLVAGIKTEQTVGIIELKIRKDVGPQETVIRFKNVKSNDGKNLVNESDKEIVIKIVEDNINSGDNGNETPSPLPTTPSTDDGNIGGNGNAGGNGNVGGNGNGSGTITPTVKPTTSTGNKTPYKTPGSVLPDKLPQTGIEETNPAILITAISVITIIATVALIKYKKMDI